MEISLTEFNFYFKVSEGHYAFMNSEAALKYIISSDYTDKSGTILFKFILNTVILLKDPMIMGFFVN